MILEICENREHLRKGIEKLAPASFTIRQSPFTKRHIVNYVGAKSLYSRMLNVCVVCLRMLVVCVGDSQQSAKARKKFKQKPPFLSVNLLVTGS